MLHRDAWARFYQRLCRAYNKPENAEQASAYYDAVQHFPELCVQQAVQRSIQESKHWPMAADLVAFAREERGRAAAPKSMCDICHGAIWVPGPPHHEFGNVYETVDRCPQCRPRRVA